MTGTKTERTTILPYCLPQADVIHQLGSQRSGLHPSLINQRINEFGYNRLPQAQVTPFISIFFRQFLDPLIYILLFAAALSLFIGHVTDAVFIFVVLCVNALIGAVQEHSAQTSARSLNQMVTSHARVLRSGEEYEIDTGEIVPGDIILLESGDKVPADARLLSQLDLHVDESLLSGESVPVEKDAEVILDRETITAERVNMVYSGALVVRGRGSAIVTATGMATELGKIASDVLQHERSKPPLLQRMERFTFRMAMSMSLVIVVFALISKIQGMAWFDVLLLAVALAVAAIPEGLPVAITVALAISMRRMAKRNVIARRLVTVEALGSCTFIAADKTGTLTQNRISVRKVALPGADEFELQIPVIEHVTNSKADFKAIPAGFDEQFSLLTKCMVLPNEAFLGHRNGSWTSHGDAVDIALLIMGHQYGYHRADLLLEEPLKSMIPFESGHRYCASQHTGKADDTVYVKGAVESLLDMCTTMFVDGNVQDLDKTRILQQAHALADQGYRVLATATGKAKQNQELNEHHLHDLCFVGLVGMIDPLRPESKEAIAQCHAAGIDVAMVTGDHPVTAFAIGRELEFVKDRSQVVTSAEFRETENDSVRRAQLLQSTRVFARMEPHQKLDIVEALQSQGHFVAVTGDGANDAPALRAAHVGVAMGKGGTDVARETADMIITDDNFSSIVAGIEEGRIAYSNVRKVIHLLISTGAGEIVLFSLSLLLGLPIPLTAVQLLWLNLVTNGIQDVALAFEPGEGNELIRPPRDPKEPIFNRIMIERVLMAAIVMGSVACFTFYTLLQNGMTEEQARNGTLLLMVLFENVHVFNSRSEYRSVFRHNPLRNPFLLLGTIAAQAIHIATMYTPGISSVLQVSPVSLQQWLAYLGLALVLLVASEIYKTIWRMRTQ